MNPGGRGVYGGTMRSFRRDDSVTSIKIAERDRLSLPGRFRLEPPRCRSRNEKKLANIWYRNRHRKCGPRDVLRIRET